MQLSLVLVDPDQSIHTRRMRLAQYKMSSTNAPVEATASIDTSATISQSVSPQALVGYVAPATLDKTTPGMSNLGCGINAATGSYLTAYLEQIVDIDALVNCAQLTQLNTSQSAMVAQETSYSYLCDQTLQAGISGGYAGFSGSLNTSFGMTQSDGSTKSLATSTELTSLYQLTIRAADRANILTAGFKKDLYDMEPQAFYATYGPYFTSTVVVGGSMSCSVQTAASNSYSQNTLEVNAKAAFDDGVSQGDVETDYAYTDTTTNDSYLCEVGIVMFGGDLALPKLATGAVDVDGWKATIADNPAVIAWVGLTPMWELVVDDDRRVSDLKGAIDAYFSAPNSYLLAPLTLSLFKNTGVKTSQPATVVVKTDTHYKVLGGGASLEQDSPYNQFLTNSNVIVSDVPNQWTTTAKSVHQSTNATLSSYAIAVYDPNDLLDVKVVSATSGTTNHPQVNVGMEAGYVMTGGGASTNPENANGLMLTASYPTGLSTWSVAAKDQSSSCSGTITATAIGVKWKNPNGKPTLYSETTANQGGVAGNPSSVVSAGGGYTLVGGGALDNYGGGKGNLLQNSNPESSPGSSTADAWYGSGHDCGDSDNCALTAYAVGLQVIWTSADGTTFKVPFGAGCLTPPPGYVA